MSSAAEDQAMKSARASESLLAPQRILPGERTSFRILLPRLSRGKRGFVGPLDGIDDHICFDWGMVQVLHTEPNGLAFRALHA